MRNIRSGANMTIYFSHVSQRDIEEDVRGGCQRISKTEHRKRRHNDTKDFEVNSGGGVSSLVD